jgi:hypothetical protein
MVNTILLGIVCLINGVACLNLCPKCGGTRTYTNESVRNSTPDVNLLEMFTSFSLLV